MPYLPIGDDLRYLRDTLELWHDATDDREREIFRESIRTATENACVYAEQHGFNPDVLCWFSQVLDGDFPWDESRWVEIRAIVKRLSVHYLARRSAPLDGQMPSQMEAAPTTQATETAEAPEKEELGAEERLLACLIKHPDWSITKLANLAEVHRTQAYRCKRFLEARDALRGNLPSGSKSKDGSMEAWDDEGD
jgi:hypothetical protein